jgi:hypothetical protein
MTIKKNKDSWINQNIELLLQYKGNWITFNNKVGLIAFGKELEEVLKETEKKTKDFSVWHVNKHFGKPRALAIRMAKKNVYTIKDEGHYWVPEYEVILQSAKKKIKQRVLVDSGSDFTIIPYQVGKDLGFSDSVEEIRRKAYGVSGSFVFLEKELKCTIDKHTFDLPVAWVLTNDNDDIILGREIVFDLFDIEFKQAVEKIVFKWRGEK